MKRMQDDILKVLLSEEQIAKRWHRLEDRLQRIIGTKTY